MTYSKQFYKDRHQITWASSRVILARLLSIFRSNSILDVGCGTGTWLAQSQQLGAKRVRGIDGPWVPEQSLEIPKDNFTSCDLSHTLPTNSEKYDLTLCIEVAEHLTQSAGDKLISFLASSSDVILFSAAIPGQGGTGHINEQPQSYWHDRFRSHDFVCFDVIRPYIWEDESVNVIYKQNMLIYVRQGSIGENELLQQFSESTSCSTKFDLDRVHPYLLELRSNQTFLRELFPADSWIRRIFSKLVPKSVRKVL